MCILVGFILFLLRTIKLIYYTDEPPLFGKGATADNYETGKSFSLQVPISTFSHTSRYKISRCRRNHNPDYLCSSKEE
jgi:hypothetical protein